MRLQSGAIFHKWSNIFHFCFSLPLLYIPGDLVGVHIFKNNSYSLHLFPLKYFSSYLYKTMRCWNSYISFGDNYWILNGGRLKMLEVGSMRGIV